MVHKRTAPIKLQKSRRRYCDRLQGKLEPLLLGYTTMYKESVCTSRMYVTYAKMRTEILYSAKLGYYTSYTLSKLFSTDTTTRIYVNHHILQHQQMKEGRLGALL